jgi:triosephosphate isomerase
MPKLIVANWKLNPQTEKEAITLAKKTDFKNVVIAPPFPFLGAVKKVLKKASLGAQDAFWEGAGAYTGEVSSEMLKRLGAKYVILGHSERRIYMNESDSMVNKKTASALKAGLLPIICVGEPKEVRKKGFASAKAYVGKQLKESLKGISESVVIAYEPIWAIGTGTPDSPDETRAMARFIRSLRPDATVLYGGSVNGKNYDLFLSLQEIGGALVGGASLRAEEFKAIALSGR